MSNSSPQIAPLSITQLSLAGEGAWPDLHVEQLSRQLNVFYGPPRTGKSSLAQLVGQLLYGKSESSWRRQFGQTVSNAEGSLQLSGTRGNFVLRRHNESNLGDTGQHTSNGLSRLTISSDQGDTVDSQTIRELLSGLSPQLAAKLYMVDFSDSPRVDWLLSENFARELNNSTAISTHPSSSHPSRQHSCCAPVENSLVDRVDRQRIDELVQRRDTIVGEIEQQLSVRRRDSEVLQRELDEVDSALVSKRDRTQGLQTRLHSLETELAELETHLRYFSLDRYAKHDGRSVDFDEQQRELTQLDLETTRCRQTLSELQQRQSMLRSELAQCRPDGTADSVTCLADGRATLGVLEQLLDDLDAEVSQLARASEPGRCIGHDSHAKLSPVASLLRQQVYTLCGQLTEQERIVRRQQLTTELRQLARVDIELSERLDLLLTHRESLIQRSQLSGQTTRLLPQPPATEHCRCEHHGNFVQLAEAMVLGRSDRGRHESEARTQLSTLERERMQLLEELRVLQHDVDQLESRWKNLQRERGGLMGSASLEDKQSELERLESVIRQALQESTPQTRSAPVAHWRASDLLAQLTDGRLVQIRLERQQPQAILVDRQGNQRSLESLSDAEHDQLYLALTLSLVSSSAQRGVHLPLILDEPFLKQDAAQTAAMTGVLDEFARAGHQLLVFTEDREAQRRFSTLHATLFDLEKLRQIKQTSTTETVVQQAAPTIKTSKTRIIRETFDGHGTPVLRLASVHEPAGGESQQDDLFYLTESSTFGDFPVLGADTSMLFSRINIQAIGDLLAADSGEVARQLDREGITTETVRLWQIHMGLMCHVPNLTLDDAQVLAASGVDSPEDLHEVDVDTLLQLVEDFLRSERGRRFERSRGRYSRSRLSGWRSGSRRYRDRWQRSSRRYSGWQSRRSQHSNTRSPRPSGQRNTEKKTRQTERSPRTTRTTRENRRPHRFYLSREQDVEDAPSIGPKTASRLAKVGIRTVADLLNADPDSTATEISVNHIKAETIAAWQHQARLVCQIPELRGYGAQLLVACGMIQPEQIARTSADELVAQILSFCETKEGQRILRSGDPPQRDKIAEWVQLATHSRPLEAA